MSFWTSDKLVEATGGELIGGEFYCSRFSIDTRSIKPGELFVALSGESFDGHEYLKKAAEADAVAALVSKVPEDVPEGFPLIKVSGDTLEVLQNLARYRREYCDTKIIGVTGSVGKTSAKEMLKLALSPYGETYATAGNFNNHIGLPLTLCNMPETARYAIIEMGMNHAGEISFLTQIAKPHVAMVTNVEAVHLEFFDSVEGIARAKAEIFEGLVERGAAILPADNEYYPLLAESCGARVLSFGEAETSDLRLLSPKVEYQYQGEQHNFTLSTHGAHWPKAALGVLACVAALQLPLEPAEAALAEYQEQKGRGEVLELPWQSGQITLMDDAYNASPVSMRAALATLAQLAVGHGRKLAVLGEMLELGESSGQLHAEMLEPILQYKIDAVVTVGAGMKALAEVLPEVIHLAHFEDAELAESKILGLIQPDDTVLCKGSHGSGVYRLVDAIKNSS